MPNAQKSPSRKRRVFDSPTPGTCADLIPLVCAKRSSCLCRWRGAIAGWLMGCTVLLLASPLWAEAPAEPGVIRITGPRVVLSDLARAELQFEVLESPSGQVDASFDGEISVTGLDADSDTVQRVPIEAGRGEWSGDFSWLAANRGVFSLRSDIELSAESDAGHRGELRMLWLPGWTSLLPPLLAIGLAVLCRNVIVSLVLGIFSGVVLMESNPGLAFLRLIDTYLLGELTQLPGGGDHIKVILFTLFLGAMIGVMKSSGGTQAMVNRLTRYATNRQRGQVMTWLMGLLVFFDDYANSLLVGGTMQSLTDRLRISREKLAFLVDATAAPVAGLVIASTWVAFEVQLIGDSLESVGIADVSSIEVLMRTIPYRFYPLLTLLFVFCIASTGRDYGPMLSAERAVSGLGEPPLPGAAMEGESAGVGASAGASAGARGGSLVDAVLPLGTLLGGIAAGLWLYLDESVWVLLVSSFAASIVGVLSALATRSLTLDQAVEGWLSGARSMFIGVTILVLAWTISSICDAEHLNTAAYIIDRVGDQLSLAWMPTVAFLVSAAIAFATGSSFTSMGLLIPLFVSMVSLMLPGEPADLVASHAFLGTLGSVLAGAILGDHCSPISDTTVLSSMATGCDHLRHVATQMPYAMTVGLVSIVGGTIPVGFGYSPWWGLAISSLVIALLVRLGGRRP